MCALIENTNQACALVVTHTASRPRHLGRYFMDRWNSCLALPKRWSCQCQIHSPASRAMYSFNLCPNRCLPAADFTRWCPEVRWRPVQEVQEIWVRRLRNRHRKNVRKRSGALRFWTSVLAVENCRAYQGLALLGKTSDSYMARLWLNIRDANLRPAKETNRTGIKKTSAAKQPLNNSINHHK